MTFESWDRVIVRPPFPFDGRVEEIGTVRAVNDDGTLRVEMDYGNMWDRIPANWLSLHVPPPPDTGLLPDEPIYMEVDGGA